MYWIQLERCLRETTHSWNGYQIITYNSFLSSSFFFYSEFRSGPSNHKTYNHKVFYFRLNFIFQGEFIAWNCSTQRSCTQLNSDNFRALLRSIKLVMWAIEFTNGTKWFLKWNAFGWRAKSGKHREQSFAFWNISSLFVAMRARLSSSSFLAELNETIDGLLLCKGRKCLWFNNDIFLSFLKKLNHKHIRHIYSMIYSTFQIQYGTALFSLSLSLSPVLTYCLHIKSFLHFICWLHKSFPMQTSCSFAFDFLKLGQWLSNANGELFMWPIIIIFMFIDFKMQSKRNFFQCL